MKITIPQPCHEQWQDMTPTEQGRFCASCQKTVVDFTSWTDKMLFDFLSKKTVECGRFTTLQLEKELIFYKPSRRFYYIAAALSFISLFTPPPYTHAQTKTQQSEETAKPTHKRDGKSKAVCTVRGSILDSKENEPVINAIVRFYKRKRLIAGCESDLNGFYEMTNLEPGKYRMIVTNVNYTTTSKIVKLSTDRPIVTENFKMKDNRSTLNVITVTVGKFVIDDSSINMRH